MCARQARLIRGYLYLLAFRLYPEILGPVLFQRTLRFHVGLPPFFGGSRSPEFYGLPHFDSAEMTARRSASSESIPDANNLNCPSKAA